MNPGKKRIAALGLLLLVAIPLFFTVAALLQQKIIQHYRNARFETETLVTITVLTEHIYWAEPGREVIIDNDFFDVKSFNAKGDSTTLTGFYDHKETELVQKIKKLARQENDSGIPISYFILKFLISPVFISQPDLSYGINFNFLKQQYYIFDEMLHTAPKHSLTHPPQFQAHIL